MAYGTVSADVIQSSVTGVSLGAGNATRFKNRIINGAMTIDQRNAGASVTITTANPTYTLDRWAAYGSVTSKYTVQQTPSATETGYATRVAAGFLNYLAATSSAATSVGSTDYYYLRQAIEGFNTADLAWGTASAKTVTLSFWVYSSLTGTFGGGIRNSANNWCYPFSYSIPTANTWTQISVTIVGPTSGTWIGATSGVGLDVNFGLGVGSTYSGTAGAWATGNFVSVTGAVSVVGTSGATFYITGVQLEVGSSATGFEYVDYTTQLAMCLRYYYKLGPATATDQPFCNAACYNTTLAFGVLPLPVEMRTFPTVSFSSATTLRLLTSNNGYSSTASAGSNTLKTAVEIAGTYSVIPQGAAAWFRSSAATDYIAMSAEL